MLFVWVLTILIQLYFQQNAYIPTQRFKCRLSQVYMNVNTKLRRGLNYCSFLIVFNQLLSYPALLFDYLPVWRANRMS